MFGFLNEQGILDVLRVTEQKVSRPQMLFGMHVFA